MNEEKYYTPDRNRPLKFRAYHTGTREWLFGYKYPNLGGFSLVGEVILCGEIGTVRLEDWNKVHIMQYSGVNDVQANEIYEGDIVPVETLVAEDGTVVERGEETEFLVPPKDDYLLGVVAFVNAGFKVVLVTEEGLVYTDIDPDCLVVGNIYDNPESLKYE